MNTANSRPWRMLVPPAIVILLCVAWSIYWLVALGVVRDMTATQRALAAQDGVSLNCAEEQWGGYPFRFEFTCTNPAAGYRGNYTIEASRIEAIAQAYNPWHVIILLDGPTKVSTLGQLPFLLTHDRAIASLRFRDGREPEVAVELPNVKFGELFEARTLMAHTRPKNGGAHGIAVSMTDIHHQRPGRAPLDIKSAGLLSTLEPDHELTVHSLELKQKDIVWNGTGMIRLDSGRRISGTLHTETNSLDGLLTILDPHLQMTKQQRTAFQTVMGLLGQQAKADIIAKDGELYIGPFKIADLTALY